MTPYELQILLDVHTTPYCDWSLPVSDLRTETIEKFAKEGIIIIPAKSNVENKYRLTDLGLAWLESILSTPMPVYGFYDPRTGDKIEID